MYTIKTTDHRDVTSTHKEKTLEGALTVARSHWKISWADKPHIFDADGNTVHYGKYGVGTKFLISAGAVVIALLAITFLF